MNDDKDDKTTEAPSPDSVRRSYLLFLPVLAFMYIMIALFLR